MLLARFGQHCNRLSLSDCYWVCEAGNAESSSKVNLYQSPMSKLLANITFTGYGSSPRLKGLSPSSDGLGHRAPGVR